MVMKLKFEVLKIVNILDISRKIIPGVVHAVTKCLLEKVGITLVIIVGESEDFFLIDSVPRKLTLSYNERNLTPSHKILFRISGSSL